jgi:hypothetical protein
MQRGGLSDREVGALNSLTEICDFRSKVFDVVQDLDFALMAKPYHLQVVYGARSAAVQMQIYTHGRTRGADGKWTVTDESSVVTRALPSESPHCYAAACDVAILHDPTAENAALGIVQKWALAEDPIWQVYGAIAHDAGLAWGGDWRSLHDFAHIEIPGWADLVKQGAIRMVGGTT